MSSPPVSVAGMGGGGAPADNRQELLRLAAKLDALRARVAAASAADPRLSRVHPRNRPSAANLLHYLALRRHDVRDLQLDLAGLGLSSLGRAEAHVLATLDAVRTAVAGLAGLPVPAVEEEPFGVASGDHRLLDNAAALFGEARNGRSTRIMVTLPATEAARDAQLVDDVVGAGAELVRIDCGTGSESDWASTLRNVREAESAQGRSLRVTMDLAGVRPRIGPVDPGPQVVRLSPIRDELGRPQEPARVWLTLPEGPSRAGAVRIPVTDGAWLARRSPGDRIRLRDTRRSRRTLVVTEASDEGALATLADTAYLVPGTFLAVGTDTTTVGALPARAGRLRLATGELLRLVPDQTPADPAAKPVRVGCTPIEVFQAARPGDRVFAADGLIAGVVESASTAGIDILVTDVAPGSSRLGAGSRLSLPDTALRVPALTEDDDLALRFIATHADALTVPFVRQAEDVSVLHHHLAALGDEGPAVLLRVETLAGFGNLPGILLAALRRPHVGVVIDRGDLALEAGYVRLGELQEEILWLCEAAHVPVVWATDVLDLLAQTGRPTRAEVTDAASAARAECVLLEHGPHVVHAVDFLDDLLSRMSEHQRKKRALLGPLRAWEDARVGYTEAL